MAYQLIDNWSDAEDFINGIEEGADLGVDTETTSLNTRIAKLVGFSISRFEGDAGYFPVGHQIGRNFPTNKIRDVLSVLNDRKTRSVFYNSKYDLNVLQTTTGFLPRKHIDGLELVYLANPDRKMKGLKLVAKEDLGMDMERFEDLFTPEEKKKKIFDISTKSPIRCLNYASADADAALRVFHRYEYIIDEFSMAVKIDTALVDIVRKMEHNGGLELNHAYIDNQIAYLTELEKKLREIIFRIVGYEFEIASPAQLGTALFERMGLPVISKTKKGAPATGAEILDKLSKTYPVAEYVVSYRKVLKARTSYFEKLKTLADMKKKPRFNFNIYAAPTFRFSAPGGNPKVDGSTGVNIQAVSNGESRNLPGALLIEEEEPSLEEFGEIETEGEIIDFDDETEEVEIKDTFEGNIIDFPYVLPNETGEYVCILDQCKFCPANCDSRGYDTTRRTQKDVKIIPSVRQSFKAPDGKKLVSFDYDRQELVIGANMSKEPRWLSALAEGKDLHAMTAAAAFGHSFEDFFKLPSHEFKRKRGLGKTMNFAVFYGADAYTLANKGDLPQETANKIYEGFVRGHPVLFQWISDVHSFARRNGYTTTYFGRKRDLSHFYSSGDRRVIAFANRSAVNTSIQGTAAEVTRIAMVKVAKRLLNEGLSSKEVRMVMQIHDELSFLIDEGIVDEVIPMIKSEMEFKVKSWKVQLTVGAKIGTVWGQQEEMELAA